MCCEDGDTDEKVEKAQAAEAAAKAEQEEADAKSKAKVEADREAAKAQAQEEQAQVEARQKADQAAKAQQAATEEADRAKASEAEATKVSAAEASKMVNEESEASAIPPSPVTASAGLPTKPDSASAAAKRAAPAALNLATASGSSDAPPSASAAALGSARKIDDLQAISYPSNLKSPASGLNDTSEPGKFRYDRDFLLQFMEICREKPESLPALDAIGLEADTSSGFGSGRGGSRAGRPSMGPPGGGRSGGIGGGRGGFPNMGNFQQMGAFGSGQMSGRPSTSEERLAQSRMPPGGNARMGGGQMHRSLSQGGPSQLPHMNSRGGQNRSQRGTKRLPNDNRMSYNAGDADVAPLVTTGDAWSGQRRRAVDEDSPEFIERKVKSLLNKLTQEKFDSISVQILAWANKSKDETDGRTLRLVIKLIFEKATDEAHWSSMYARLCRFLLDQLSEEVSDTIDGKSVSGGPLFRKYLLGRCQVDFESGWKSREDAASAALATSEEDKARIAAKAAKGEEEAEETKEEQPQEAAMLSDEYYAAQKAKRRGLGLVQLIGELFKAEMLTKSVIVTCMVKLLSNVNDPDEEDIESTCKLLTTVGAVMERNHSSALDVFFDRLKDLSKSPNINSRMRFMVLVCVPPRRRTDQYRTSWSCVETDGSCVTLTVEYRPSLKFTNKQRASRPRRLPPPRRAPVRLRRDQDPVKATHAGMSLVLKEPVTGLPLLMPVSLNDRPTFRALDGLVLKPVYRQRWAPRVSSTSASPMCQVRSPLHSPVSPPPPTCSVFSAEMDLSKPVRPRTAEEVVTLECSERSSPFYPAQSPLPERMTTKTRMRTERTRRTLRERMRRTTRRQALPILT